MLECSWDWRLAVRGPSTLLFPRFRHQLLPKFILYKQKLMTDSSMAFPTEVQMKTAVLQSRQGRSSYSMFDSSTADLGGRVVMIEKPIYDEGGICKDERHRNRRYPGIGRLGRSCPPVLRPKYSRNLVAKYNTLIVVFWLWKGPQSYYLPCRAQSS